MAERGRRGRRARRARRANSLPARVIEATHRQDTATAGHVCMSTCARHSGTVNIVFGHCVMGGIHCVCPEDRAAIGTGTRGNTRGNNESWHKHGMFGFQGGNGAGGYLMVAGWACFIFIGWQVAWHESSTVCGSTMKRALLHAMVMGENNPQATPAGVAAGSQLLAMSCLALAPFSICLSLHRPFHSTN